jgi:hypothetical protein
MITPVTAAKRGRRTGTYGHRVDYNCEQVDSLVLGSPIGRAGGSAPRRDTWARLRLSDSLVAES